MKRILLIINCIILAIGAAGAPLLLRLYFIHGGNRVWLSCFFQSAAFPLILIPLSISYIYRSRIIPPDTNTTKPKMFSMNPSLFVASTVIGVLNGFDSYLFTYGWARLPVSTSTLIFASQLTFVAIFAFLFVKQKFTVYSVNAVVLLTFGAGVLAMHGSGDRPAGESNKQYVMGFVVTTLAAVLNGFTLPLLELVYKKAGHAFSYSLGLEIQLIMGLFATLFCIVGMIVDNDFKVISKEATHFEFGEANYYAVLLGCAILWQLYVVGAMGVIVCASSLLCGIMIAVMLPVTEVLAIIFYKEKFRAEKGASLALSLWGFASYFYGEFKQANETKNSTPETELPQNQCIPNP